MSGRAILGGLLVLLFGCAPTRAGSPFEEPAEFQPLLEGLEMATVRTTAEEGSESTLLHFLRLDPRRWRLRPYHYADEGAEAPMALEEWVDRIEAPVVFNAGFYDEDRRHLGLLVRHGRNLGTRTHPKWKGLLVSDPADPDRPGIDILDLLEESFSLEDPPYDMAIQSLMILENGRKRVSKTDRTASRTAAARDRKGRILIVWAEGSHSLWDLADLLDRAELGIDRAMVLDGGREAQLAVETPEVSLRRYGTLTRGALSLLESRVPLPAVVALIPREPATETTGGDSR